MQIRESGAHLVAISPQIAKYSANIVRRHGLEFPVLCDAGNLVARRFRATFTYSEVLRETYLGFGLDLARYNGNDAWELPLSSRFIATTDGNIANAQFDPDYTVRPEPSELVEILGRLT